jgi:tripartite-type tricarboxylate transporter receptor subunit TctC
MKRIFAASAAVIAAGAAIPAAAQSYPARPVRILVGYAPGGGVDVAARIVAQGLTEVWGNQTALVENRPGAAGNIATELTASAAPDGYTLLLCTIASHGITPARSKKLSYDPVKSFSFPSMVGITPNIIVTHPAMAMRSLKDVIAYARKNPGKLNYGSSGVGASPNLSMELLKLDARLDIQHVPYKGAALAMADVASGHMELMVGNLPGPYPLVVAGKLRALAVTSGERSPKLPDVPTVAEQGVKDFDVSSWYGICGQSGIQKPVFDKLRTDLLAALARPETRKRLTDQGIEPKTTTPEDFVKFVNMEMTRWARVVKAAKIPDQ